MWAKCGQGGEGVQNPENFADVLYVWSLTDLYYYVSFLSIAPLSVDDHLVILYTNTNPNGHFVHKYQPERSFCTQILTRFDTLRRGEV